MTRTRLSAPLTRAFADDKTIFEKAKETIGEATEYLGWMLAGRTCPS